MKSVIAGIIYMIVCSTILGLSSCSKKQENRTYIVEGNFNDSKLNGKTIYIMRYDDNKLIDTTVIKGNRFVFRGTVDTVHTVGLISHTTNSPVLFLNLAI